MYGTHAEPNWRATESGQPEVEKTDVINSCYMFFFWSFSTALIIYGIYHLPLEFMLPFLAFAIIGVLMYFIEKCCVKVFALDTQTGTRNGSRTGTGNRPGTRNRTGNGTTGNSDEFILYDLQM